MLLPLLLRGLIAGTAGGSYTRRELGRVVEGIPEDAEQDQGERPVSDRAPKEGEEKLKEDDIKIGFFLVSFGVSTSRSDLRTFEPRT